MAAALSWAGIDEHRRRASASPRRRRIPSGSSRDTAGTADRMVRLRGRLADGRRQPDVPGPLGANVAADMRANGWDGVFVDDTNASQSWHLCGRTIAKYPTDAAYAGRDAQLPRERRPVADLAGLPRDPEHLPSRTARARSRPGSTGSRSPRAGCRSTGRSGAHGTTGHFADADWTYRQPSSARPRRPARSSSGSPTPRSSDVRSMRYARSTFLLDWDGGASALLFEAGSGDRSGVVRLDDRRRHPADGARYRVGAAWRRDYTRRHRPRQPVDDDSSG